MPNKIKYSIHTGPENDKFGLRETTPSSAILISDNKSSNFSLKTTNKYESLSVAKRIYETKSLSSTTAISCNSTDILMTDMFSADGEPLFYKINTKVKYFDKLFINNIEHDIYDINFVYTVFNSGTIRFEGKDGTVLLEEESEFLPVFIWESFLHLEDVMSLDDKTYSFSTQDDRIFITASKPNVFAVPNEGSIFDLTDSNMTYSVNPFIHRSYRNIEGSRVVFTYDYSLITPNVRTVSFEQGNVVGRDVIRLKNTKVMKNSIKISIINNKTKEEEYSIDNTGGTFENNNISSEYGTINIKEFAQAYDIDVDDYMFMVSYTYLDVIGNKTFLDPENFNLKNKKVFFSIRPTEIKQDEVVNTFPPTIAYTITDSLGNILSSIDDIPLSSYVAPVYKGFGEDAYSEHGYSGETSDLATEFFYYGGDIDGTGYSEGSYSEGPFGGSYIKSIEDVQRLLEVQNNSIVGSINVAEIDFTPRVENANIYFIDRVAESLNGNSNEELELFSGSIWHKSISSDFSNVQLAEGIQEYRSLAGTYFYPAIVLEDSTNIMLEFDISKVSDYLDAIGNLDTSYVTSNPDVINALDLYTQFIPECEINIDTLTLFVDGNEYPTTITISSDLSKAYVSIPISEKGKTVGLGIKDVITIYPVVTIEV